MKKQADEVGEITKAKPLPVFVVNEEAPVISQTPQELLPPNFESVGDWILHAGPFGSNYAAEFAVTVKQVSGSWANIQVRLQGGNWEATGWCHIPTMPGVWIPRVSQRGSKKK